MYLFTFNQVDYEPVTDDYEANDQDLQWTLIESTEDQLSFDIYFDRPLELTQEYKMDKLDAYLNMTQLLSEDDLRRLNAPDILKL